MDSENEQKEESKNKEQEGKMIIKPKGELVIEEYRFKKFKCKRKLRCALCEFTGDKKAELNKTSY